MTTGIFVTIFINMILVGIDPTLVPKVLASPTKVSVDYFGSPDIVDPSLSPGTVFTVNVTVDIVEVLYGYQFKLGEADWWELNHTKYQGWNASILRLLAVENGPFLTSQRGIADWFPGAINDTQGTLTLSGAVVTNRRYPTGGGTLANLTFQVVGIGVTPIHFGLDSALLNKTLGFSLGPDWELYRGTLNPDFLVDGSFDNTPGDTTPPVANAGPDQTVDEDTLVTFNGSGSTDNIGIVSYTWTFTDGGTQTLTGVNPTYTFNNPGVYTVTLNVTDADDNWDIDTVEIAVLASYVPQADAGPDQTVDEDTLVLFDGSNSTDDVGIVNYTWTFTDVTVQTLTGVNPNYTFANPGVYTVTLNVTDADGYWDTDTVEITVLDVTDPIADAGPDQTVDEDTLVTFDGSNSTDNVGITGYNWTFTDAAPKSLTGVSPTYTFTTSGIYTVTLNVTDADGNWDTDVVVITVLDATDPDADAGPDQTVDAGTLVTFNGTGSTDNVGIEGYTWTFTDVTLQTLTGANPAYNFTNSGVYSVTLNVTDADGNWDTDVVVITVLDATDPVADAGPNQTIYENTVATFDGSDSTDNVGIEGYTWTFTDVMPKTLTGVDPTYNFTNPGVYSVTLNVTDAAGNWDTDAVTITVLDVTGPTNGGSSNQTMDVNATVTFALPTWFVVSATVALWTVVAGTIAITILLATIVISLRRGKGET